MELVEGPTLADRIAQGPIPVDEALPIAKQIAEALEAAHEQGIIHRDLKPANIKVRPDGTVKVLDFGLAKALEPMAVGRADATASPTITSPAMMTGVGMLLGSAAYMSPEQARGKAVDRRIDIWAFGCVLFEMLTGTRAFGGEDVSETLANVLKSEPDWSALPPVTPRTMRILLRRCLTKERKRRLDSVADARLEIDDALTSSADDAPIVSSGGRKGVAAATLTALVIGGAVTATTVWLAMRPAPLQVVRTAIPTAGASGLGVSVLAAPHLTITPDGSRVVYSGAGQIFVRALDQLEPTALPGLGVPQGLFAAPDSNWVGFYDGTLAFKTVSITGGPAVTVAPADSQPRGATWGVDGTIVFATNTPATGLQRVPAAGGEVTVLTTPDRARGESDHIWPEFLPDGQAVLFTITAVSGGLAAAQIAVRDLRTGTESILLRGGSHARYLPTGHLVYGVGGTLRAVAFDLKRLVVIGTPVPVLESVVINQAGGVEASVSRNGTLAYVSGGTVATVQRTLAWVDKQGREEPVPMPPRAYQQHRLSPDGTRVALSSTTRSRISGSGI